MASDLLNALISFQLQQFLTQALGPNAQLHVTATGAGLGAPQGHAFTFTAGGPSAGPAAFANPQQQPGGAPQNPSNILSALLGEALGIPAGGQAGGAGSFFERLFASAGMVGNPGDYAFGREFDDIVTRLMEQGVGKDAPPPAKDDVIEALPRVVVGKEEAGVF